MTKEAIKEAIARSDQEAYRKMKQDIIKLLETARVTDEEGNEGDVMSATFNQAGLAFLATIWREHKIQTETIQRQQNIILEQDKKYAKLAADAKRKESTIAILQRRLEVMKGYK